MRVACIRPHNGGSQDGVLLVGRQDLDKAVHAVQDCSVHVPEIHLEGLKGNTPAMQVCLHSNVHDA